MKLTSSMPEAMLLNELGTRAQKYRVALNLSQAELANHAGVSQRTVERLEAGSSVQLEKLLRILRALTLTDNLNALIPEASIRPIQLAGSKTDVRQRANKRAAGSPKKPGWSWGDQK